MPIWNLARLLRLYLHLHPIHFSRQWSRDSSFDYCFSVWDQRPLHINYFRPQGRRWFLFLSPRWEIGDHSLCYFSRLNIKCLHSSGLPPHFLFTLLAFWGPLFSLITGRYFFKGSLKRTLCLQAAVAPNHLSLTSSVHTAVENLNLLYFCVGSPMFTPTKYKSHGLQSSLLIGQHFINVSSCQVRDMKLGKSQNESVPLLLS